MEFNGLHFRELLQAGPFAVSKNWLGLEGAVSSQSERVFKMSRDHTI